MGGLRLDWKYEVVDEAGVHGIDRGAGVAVSGVGDQVFSLGTHLKDSGIRQSSQP